MAQVGTLASRFETMGVASMLRDTQRRSVVSTPAALPLVVATKRPNKLTALERKERDRLRMKEQSQRRKHGSKEQSEQAKRFAQEREATLMWHQQQRCQEELVLRRLERDVVEPHRSHPAAAGYLFDAAAQKVTTSSPVFVSYSYALCPPTQALRSQQLGLLRKTKVSAEAEYLHPACHGYAMAKHDDSRHISPVFFFTSFVKVPLDIIVINRDDNDTDKSDAEDRLASRLDSLNTTELCQHGSKRCLDATMLVGHSMDGTGLGYDDSRASPTYPTCKESATTARYSGSFPISSKEPGEIQATQWPATTKEKRKCARQKASHKKMIMPLLLPQLPLSHLATRLLQDEGQKDASNRDLTLLFDSQAIHEDQTLSSRTFITLHVKSLPIGQLLSLTVKAQTSVSRLYELYRAKSDPLHQSWHLLLPTTRGLFYFDEHIASATDTRLGVVNGELLLEDFNLQKTTRSDRVDHDGDNHANGEFLLFAVASLHLETTPQLIWRYVRHNFDIKPLEAADSSLLVRPADNRDNEALPQWSRIVFATCLVPKDVELDPLQAQLRAHIQAMHAFTQSNYAIVAAEQREERELLLRLAHEEAKRAELALKKQRRNEDVSVVSKKIQRALASFNCIRESTSDFRSPHEAEARLGTLWQFVQWLEEWKICKGGRLVDAAKSNVTLLLVQELRDTVAVAFNEMMFEETTWEANDGARALPYPVYCLQRGNTRKLVVHVGIRMGVLEQDDCNYGIVLNLAQDVDEQGPEQDCQAHDIEQRVERWEDGEWRRKDLGVSTLASSVDLFSPPFLWIKWPLIVKAYKVTLQQVAFVSSKLEGFNTLANVLRTPDAIRSTAQLLKWQEDVNYLLRSLPDHCALAYAIQRVLCRKGVALLKRQVRQQQLDCEEQVPMRELQLQDERPKVTPVQQQTVALKKKRALELHLLLERTPAEMLYAKAGELLEKAVAGVAKAARHVKREYAVRTL